MRSSSDRVLCESGVFSMVPYGELHTMLAKPRVRRARIPASSNAQRRMCWNSVHMAFRVLIVDDNRSFLEAARGLLEREGLRVVGVAATSAEALQRAEELQPEVVLVDIRLGGESGFDLARRLAEQPRAGLAVILISTYSEADFVDLIAESPARGF